jgi:GntR family histidine utilization transcriptional repressor
LSGKAAAKALPKHQRIRRDIEARIMSGEWQPGERIPYEHELMETYDCSRMTVNKALRSLTEAGMLQSRRRAGTFVTVPSFDQAALQIPDIRDEVRRSGSRYGYRLLSQDRRQATAEDCKRLRIDRAEILCLECLHSAGDAPYALETRLINLDAVPGARDVDFSEEPPGSWLLKHVPWTEAEHRITAADSSEEEASLLDLDPAGACLVLERWTWRRQERITHVRQIFPGGKYSLVARFNP